MLRRFARVLFYIALSLYIEWLATLYAILRYPGWHPEILRFTSCVWESFLVHIGSSGPGFISPIILVPVTIVLTIVLILAFLGWTAMKERAIETVLIGILVFVVGLLLIYGPQFAWQVAKVTRDEHRSDIQAIGRLEDAAKHPCPPPPPQPTFVEPENSLRRRTVRLVYDISDFWSRRPMPAQPVQNPTGDEEKKRNAAWDKYWQDAQTAYKATHYRERLLEVAMQFKNQGFDTQVLERSLEQPDRMIGSFPYGGSQLENCSGYMTELCQLEYMAYRVDEHDKRYFIEARGR